MNLEQRIARLEAIEAIKTLKARYFHACDTKQPELVRACFAPGPITLDYGRVGQFRNREDMLAVFTRLACSDHIVEMHHGQNPQIDVRSEIEASAVWGLHYYLIDTQQQIATQLAGFYDDEYRCIDGQWLITASRYRVSSTQVLDLSGEQVRAIFAGAEAPRELDDPERQAAEADA
jgi:hypothetical protein